MDGALDESGIMLWFVAAHGYSAPTPGSQRIPSFVDEIYADMDSAGRLRRMRKLGLTQVGWVKTSGRRADYGE
jgi:hypothetical protein